MMNRNILHPMMFETPTPMGEGVYHSTELGLISLSVDGTTWYTIADKNLGASSLGGNGLYYQRGNNYGFGSGNYVWQQRVDATNYGPYYDSNLWYFKSGITESWDSSGNPNLWGDTTNTWEARRGPAIKFNPNAYVPSFNEVSSFASLLSNLGISSTEIESVLLMPKGGEMYHSYGNLRGVGEQGSYWTSTGVGGGCRCFQFNDDGIILYRGLRSGEGLNIRCFLHDYEQGDDERQLHTGVRWSPSKEYIRVTDGTTTYVLMDKNLGATQVYMVGDTYSENNCGYFYQWGNNHGFPGLGSSEQVQTTDQQVNASNYGPYYYSSDFIGTYTDATYNWSSVTNKNLWGGITNTDIAKRGPCPEGFHIPTMLEESEFERNLGILGGSISTIYMPNTGLMYPNMSVYDRTFRGVWTSQRVEGGDTPYFRGNFYRSYGAGRGMQIRPFKNIPVVPDSTRTKLL